MERQLHRKWSTDRSMIHAREKTFVYHPLIAGDDATVLVTMRVVSEREYEQYVGSLKGTLEDMSYTFSFAFVSCEGIVDSDGAPLKTAEAIIEAPGLKHLISECVGAFHSENGLTNDKKKGL